MKKWVEEKLKSQNFREPHIADLNRFMERQFSKEARAEIEKLIVAAAVFRSHSEILGSLEYAWQNTWASQDPAARGNPAVEENRICFSRLYSVLASGRTPEIFQF